MNNSITVMKRSTKFDAWIEIKTLKGLFETNSWLCVVSQFLMNDFNNMQGKVLI